MAVQVVFLGRLPSQREWYGRCSNCKTAVEYLQEDALSHGSCQRDGDWTTVKCPLTGCNHEIYGSIKAKPPESR